MSRDGERLIELVNELGSRISHLLSDMVPPAAQVHLLNAQRELITALMLIYEHRVTTPPPGRARRSAAAPRRAAQRRRTPARAGKIPIE
ncbi:MAG: hypothetical protein AUH69_07700 [Actinobacteria bacterium 13_1_40CM_4_65_12]|nr:MAG: hypothetical protein AUH69_07700 [Actinobacteria bacterium 13_1_40CM_4_65_12]